MLQQTLFTGWHFMRWLRLGLSLFIAFQAVQTQDIFSGIIAIFLLFQVVTNTGCCGANGCAAPNQTTHTNTSLEDVQFEEVK